MKLKDLKYLVVVGFIALLSSCSKDCITPEENTDLGAIVTDSHVKGHGLAHVMFTDKIKTISLK